MRMGLRPWVIPVAIVIIIALWWILTPSRVPVAAMHPEQEHAEDSVTLDDIKVKSAGIEILAAGAGVLRQKLRINGVLQPNQESLVQITPRFPGIVRDVRKRIGDRVEKGEILATVESNQSLTVYELRAPITGTVIDRQITLGEYASEQKPAFVVADLGTVWADFSVHRRDLNKIRVGDAVTIDPEDGGTAIEAKVSYIAPLGANDTQTALVRAVVNNVDLRLRPGLFVSAIALHPPKQAALVVKASAIQTLENRTVIFVRDGTKFQAREVELGESDGDQIEILFGLNDGDLYAGKNSFVIKSELGKATAEHNH